jgi:hypothetical protein
MALETGGATPMSFWTNNAERMRIVSDGKVGIGTSAPGVALDVNGAIKYNSFASTDGSSGLNITASYSYNDNNTNTIGSHANKHWNFIFVSTLDNGRATSIIPVYSNGGNGVAFAYTYLDLDNGTWTAATGSSNFSFQQKGSGGNTYTVAWNSSNAAWTVQRTSGSVAYIVYVQVIVQ